MNENECWETLCNTAETEDAMEERERKKEMNEWMNEWLHTHTHTQTVLKWDGVGVDVAVGPFAACSIKEGLLWLNWIKDRRFLQLARCNPNISLCSCLVVVVVAKLCVWNVCPKPICWDPSLNQTLSSLVCSPQNVSKSKTETKICLLGFISMATQRENTPPCKTWRYDVFFANRVCQFTSLDLPVNLLKGGAETFSWTVVYGQPPRGPTSMAKQLLQSMIVVPAGSSLALFGGGKKKRWRRTLLEDDASSCWKLRWGAGKFWWAVEVNTHTHQLWRYASHSPLCGTCVWSKNTEGNQRTTALLLRPPILCC